MEPRAAPPLQFFHPFTLLSFLLRINGLCLQCFSFSQIRSNLEHFGSSKSYVIHRFPRRFPIFGNGAQAPSLFLDVVQFFRFFCFRSFYLSQKRRGGGFFIFFIPLLATSYNFQPLFYILNHNFRFVKSFFQKNKKLHKKFFGRAEPKILRPEPPNSISLSIQKKDLRKTELSKILPIPL